jgi:drug/metabolite transporter (DMT)-like permease
LTLFTAVLEPLLKAQRILKLEICVGLVIICGMYIIFKFETRYTYGIICGLLSALSASIFSIINSKQIRNRSATIISFYELISAWIWMSLFLFTTSGVNLSLRLSSSDLFYLLVLGIVCTSVAYVAGVSVMKELSAFRVALITNLEPVYGIILAFLFFGKSEQMSLEFYIGAGIVLVSILLYPVIRNKIEKRAFIKQIPLG